MEAIVELGKVAIGIYILYLALEIGAAQERSLKGGHK